MKMNLLKENLFSIVDGTETAPEESGNLQAHAKYLQRRDKALATIVLAVDPKLLYLLGDPTDPVDVWDKLSATFQKKTFANRLRLKKRLYTKRLVFGGSMQKHLKEFVELFEELAVIGAPLQEEDKVICLLASLPDSYSTLVTALEAMDKVPSWENVSEKLLNEEQKSCELKSVLPVSEASLVSKSNEKQKWNGKCFECGKSGHVRSNCYIFRKKKAQKKASASVAANDDGTVLFASALVSGDIHSDSWIIDSGATQHMCNNVEAFREKSKLAEIIKIQVGDGRIINSEYIGSVSLKLNLPGNKVSNCKLRNVLFVPELAHNLISVSQASMSGNAVKFSDDKCEITNEQKLVAVGSKVGKLYLLDLIRDVATRCSSVSDDERLWHNRFCHLGINNLRKLVKNDMVKGTNFEVTDEKFLCTNCFDGKMCKSPIPSVEKRNLKPFDLIYSDVCGPVSPASLGNGKYFVSFIDHCTRYSWVYIIKNKSEVFKTFKDWKTLVENLYETKVKIIRSDNGGEYTSAEFESFLLNEGIVHEKTIPRTPEQNGVAERKNRTIFEAVRSMLSQSGLPKSFWGEAVSTANYVINRSPSAALSNITPYEALNKRKPNVGHFRVFGCVTYSHIPDEMRRKLDFKSKRCVFVGYGNTTKGYRLYDFVAKRVFYSRNLFFDESQFLKFEKEHESLDINANGDSVIQFSLPDDTCDSAEPVDVNIRRSTRVRREPDRYGEWLYTCNSDSVDPKTIKEALARTDSSEWQMAMQKEFDAITNNKVWSLVQPKPDQKLIKTKWVFKRKLGADGSPTSYKARLVAQGFSQRPGVDYDETFSPVVRFESVRSIFAIAAQHDLTIHHMDFTSAFLNGELKEDLYVSQPEGFIVPGQEQMVCRLHKSLYGLKQSPKCWNSSLDSFLLDLGYNKLDGDSCIYMRDDVDGVNIIAVYVDDLLICAKSDSINSIKRAISSRYAVNDLGKLKYFLGINVSQYEDKIVISQSAYTKSLIRKFGLENAKSVSTPGDASSFLEKATDESKLFDCEIYQSAVGALLYLSTKTRPDIAYCVSNVAKFSSLPTVEHWTAVKRILRYLKGTENLGIAYRRNNFESCSGYADADWAGDRTDRRSTSGYCFKLNGGLISWRSNKQTCVALSTAEAEYVALAAAAQEAAWLRTLFTGLKFCNGDAIVINEDNQAAIYLSKDSRNHPKTKHISIKYHFVRDMIEREEISVKYCPTTGMLADIFTKTMPAAKFVKLRDMIGMEEVGHNPT